MFCKNCGKESVGLKKFCTNCGMAFSNAGKINEEAVFPNAPTTPRKSASEIIKKGLGILFVVALVGWGTYNSLNEDVVEKNNDAISNFDAGNSQQAIDQLKDASQNAVSNENKINTLKNLAYVYSAEGKTSLAISSFKEALALTAQDSLDYYLISGEIALFEGKPNAAQIAYNKAYQKDPDDFQVNNALALFYLDLEEIAPDYTDYKKALQYAQRASQLTDLQIAKQNLGIAYFFNENYNQAITVLSRITLDKDTHTAYWIGLSYAGNEDHVNAEFYLRKAIANGVEVPQEVHDYLNSN